MAKRKKSLTLSNLLERFTTLSSGFFGNSLAFILAVLLIVLWSVTGTLFNFSNTWQITINTITNIITFLMVFLIQRTQNKDAMVIQLKLNELIAALRGASNRLINIESIPEEDIKTLHKFYEYLAAKAQQERDLLATHSIEDAEEIHQWKMKERLDD
jgi:low affinity Fe/Cu permease